MDCRGVRVAICATVLVSVTVAQQTPVFKSKTELVLVPAAVTRDGRPLAGLTSKDFVLLHDGKQERISVFEEIEAVPARADPVNLPPQTVQNYAPGDGHQDIVIVVIDFRGTTSSYGRLRKHLVDVAQQFILTKTPVTVLALSGSGLVRVHSFTADPENLVKAVARWASTRAASDAYPAGDLPDWASPTAPTETDETSAALMRADERLRRAPNKTSTEPLSPAPDGLDALEQIAEAYRGVPGRKKLIWLGVIPYFPLRYSAGYYKSTRIWKSLSDLTFAVYAVRGGGVSADASGTGNYFDVGYDPCISGGITVSASPRGAGIECLDRPPECVQRVLSDAPHYYVLGFYLHGENKPGRHKLQVKVNLPKVSVRARAGFMLGQGKPPSAQEKLKVERERVTAALASPLDYTGLPLRLQWSAVSGSGNGSGVELVLSSPPGTIGIEPKDTSINLDYVVFVKPAGKKGRSYPEALVAQLRPEQQKSLATSGFLYRKRLELPPGRYEIRVLLRDNVAGNIGTVSTLVDLPSVH